MLLQWESQAAALQLLGHASAHTTAEYAKSELRQLRELGGASLGRATWEALTEAELRLVRRRLLRFRDKCGARAHGQETV